MYNDTLKAENKIITREDLTQIFQLMGETLKKYQKIFKVEEMQNKMLDFSYQKYTFKDNGSKMRVIVDFYDNTNITFDNYDNFMSIFYSRIDEIKSIDINYFFYYDIVEPEPNKRRDYCHQSINMYINENKMNIMLNLKSDDPKLLDIYNLIKTKILNAPDKYDDIIKNRKKINNTVAFGVGLIPGLMLSIVLLFIPSINMIFFKGYVVYPICVLLIAYLIGNMIASNILDRYYEPIVPNKKYAGHDSNYNSIYKDDIDSFVGTSEILIGKKVNNLENRKRIQLEYEKYNSFIKKELIVLIVSTIIVVIIGFSL